MLKGNHTLELNATTVTEAIQYWMNATMMKHPVKVTSVTHKSVNTSTTLIVKFEEVSAEDNKETPERS